MKGSSSLDEIVLDIKQLADRDNLACVLIHLNDTYFIDEREPDIPGMARVAGLAQKLRDTVVELVGEDRTLLLHSGDYLSPSAMSKQFKGAQMVELLTTCSVNFATLGNHEFDFTAPVIWDRLKQMKTCIQVLANLDPPHGQEFTRVAFWPQKKPFLAVTGLVGQQTIGKAIDPEYGFKQRDWHQAAAEIVENVRSRPGIGSLIVLSHMDRKEDKELQTLLSDLWEEHGFLYLLGGHDHDIWWREQDRRYCYLSKCKSNCKSITVFLLPKDGIAAPFTSDIGSLRHWNEQRSRKRLSTMHLGGQNDLRALLDRDSEPLPAELLPIRDEYPDSPLTEHELLDSVLQEYRSTVRPELRDDFRRAFEVRIQDAFGSMGRASWNEAIYHGTLAYDVVSWASAYAIAGFSQTAREISSEAHLHALPSHDLATRQVAAWKQKMTDAAGEDLDVVDFTPIMDPPGRGMDARDTSLRHESTDFGNFVADAIKVATGAEIALINSGAFRIDGFISPKVTRNILRDVFIYDGPRSIAVIKMEVNEIGKFYDNSLEKDGQGAFLQVSESREAMETRTGPIEVALVAHMLKHDEDGYQSILTSSRCVDADTLLEATGVKLIPESMVELIERGARKGVTYSRKMRLRATSRSTSTDIQEEEFLRITDRYRKACIDTRIIDGDQLKILNGSGHEIPQERVKEWLPEKLDKVALTRNELYRFVRSQKSKSNTFVSRFREHLYHSPRVFAASIRYQDYFDAAVYLFT